MAAASSWASSDMQPSAIMLSRTSHFSGPCCSYCLHAHNAAHFSDQRRQQILHKVGTLKGKTPGFTQGSQKQQWHTPAQERGGKDKTPSLQYYRIHNLTGLEGGLTLAAEGASPHLHL
jgi:hypothetical protein